MILRDRRGVQQGMHYNNQGQKGMLTAHISKKRVCFPSLDWKEEDRRTEKGVNSRSQHKKEKKQRKMAAARLPADTYRALMDPSNEHDLIVLARDPNRPTFDWNFTLFYQNLQGSGQLLGQDGGTFSTRLLQLRESSILFRSMTAPMIDALSAIGSLPGFQQILHPTVSSDSD